MPAARKSAPLYCQIRRSFYTTGVRDVVNREKLAEKLRECTDRRDLSGGKLVHEKIIMSGLERSRFLANLLVEMYGKCQDMENARLVFTKMEDRNVFSWNICIAANARNGHHVEALRLFREMDLEGIKPSEATFVSVITSISELGSIDMAAYIRDRVETCGLGSQLVVGTALVGMYGRCKRPRQAREVFESLSVKNVVSWTSMIRAYVLAGQNRGAMELYKAMDVTPNEYTFSCIADGCDDLDLGRELEMKAVSSGYGSLKVVGVAIVGMFCKLGSLDDAERFLLRHSDKDVFCWNQIIAASAGNPSSTTKPLELYRAMTYDHGVEPDSVTFLELLKSCSDSNLGQHLHACVAARGLHRDEVVSTALVTMYGRSAMPDAAWRVFAKIERKNVISWTTMIAAYGQNDRSREALEIFHAMDLEGIKPSRQTFVTVANSLAALADGRRSCSKLARLLEERAVATGFAVDGLLANAVVDLYGKLRLPEEARRVFDAMVSRSAVTWTSMIQAYAQCGRREDSFALFREMDVEPSGTTFVSVLAACAGSHDLETGRAIHAAARSRGLVSDVFVGTALVDMFGKCGDCDAARCAFDAIAGKTVVSWNAMLAVYVQNGCPRQALELWQSGDAADRAPDKVTLVLLLDACGALGEIDLGRALHRCVIVSRLDDQSSCVGNALVTMYASCGRLDDAAAAFRAIQRKNSASWNAMAAALASQGRRSPCLHLFCEMALQGFAPDEATLAALLSACSHAGSKLTGWLMFVSMEHDFGVPRGTVHYVCVVDMLGRLGQLEEAESLLGCMPVEPGFVGWMTLLGSCGKHGDVQRGAGAARYAAALNDRNAAANYVLLANMYAGIVSSDGGDC